MKKDIPSLQKMLNIWAVILVVWSVYRTKFFFPEWFDEFLAKPIVFVLPVYWYITQVEKKDFLKGIWFKTHKIFDDVYLGVFIGILFALSAIVSNVIKHGSLSLENTLLAASSSQFLTVLIISLATAFSEEVLSRGFILKRLYEDSKNLLTASLNASVLFFILHIPILFTNERLTGETLLLFLITDVLLSLAVSFIFLIRKNLLLPILIHAFYNLAIVLYV